MNTMSDRMATGRGNKSGWSLAALALVSFAVLIALGSWQLDRSEWKRALIAERQAMLVQPPVILTGDAVDAKAASFRRVSLTGTFLHNKERRIGPGQGQPNSTQTCFLAGGYRTRGASAATDEGNADCLSLSESAP